MTEKTMKIRCRAFSCEGIRINRVRIDSDGLITVYDSIAGYYTRCHSISDADCRRIRRKGRQKIDKARGVVGTGNILATSFAVSVYADRIYRFFFNISRWRLRLLW